VAVHQPMGKTGLVLWSGNSDGTVIEKAVAEYGYELQAFGDIFMSKLEELHGDQSPGQEFPLLSKRELECIRLIANGHSMSEISKALDVSSNTVRYHLDNCRKKLEAKTMTHAVALCAQYGLLGRIGNDAE
ncbi:MAG: helix-turn-helix transcriptional regulator, partial [Paracoccaceae bacterium]